MNGRSLLKSTLLTLNLIFAVALLLSSSAHLVDPNTFLFPAFFGLAFLPIFLLNVVLLLGWLMLKPKFALINVAVIALSWSTVAKHLQFFNESTEPDSASFEVMSFNVRLFDLYNWKGNESTRNEILDYLSETKSDVHCFQEFFNSNKNSYFNTLDTLLDHEVGTEVHEEFTAILHEGMSKFGIATLSKAPILHRERIHLDTAMNNIAIFSDILIGKDTLRFFNIHLASVHLSGLEKDINKHLETNDQEGQLKDLQIISQRLANGFKRRAKQAKVIREAIDASPHPVIVTGDFNDTPASFAYNILSEGLQDAYVVQGNGVGSTYIGLYPMLRIDFILVDPRLTVNAFSTEKVTLSDHRPIRATISLTKPSA